MSCSLNKSSIRSINLKSSMGFSLSKFGAPLEPGNGIDLEDLLPEGAEVSGSSVMFIIFLWAAEFGFILLAGILFLFSTRTFALLR